MNSKISLAVCLFDITGCANQEAFVKNNIRYSTYERDVAYCETKSTQEVSTNRSVGAEITVAL